MKNFLIFLFSIELAASAALAQAVPDTAKPSQAPDSATLQKAMPRVAVLDFVSLSPAPARTAKLVAERVRFGIMNSKKLAVADAGEIARAMAELGLGRPDSMGAEQIVTLGNRLGTQYLIVGFVTDYREGDIEFGKHRMELLGKVFDCRTGELMGMEMVKVKKKGEVREMANAAADKLARKLMEIITTK